MYAPNPKCISTLAKKNVGVQSRYSHRPTKLAFAMNGALICFGVATITLAGAVFAQSNMVTDTAVHAYKIPPGPT